MSEVSRARKLHSLTSLARLSGVNLSVIDVSAGSAMCSYRG